MADPEIKRTAHRGDCIAKAHDRISDIVPSGLDYQQRSRLTDVLSKVWDDGYGHGRHDEATGEPADIAADDEDRIRDAMAEAQEHPGRIVTR